jgi:hypothetical protein
MPVYLLHGFRWPRGGFTGIRVHIIIHNLDDCSAEYIQNPVSQAELLKSFRQAHPELMKELDLPPLGQGKGLHFLEQYDPEDELGETAASQPYAFVGDKVVTIASGPSAASLSLGKGSPMASPPSTATSEPATPGSRLSKGSVGAGIAAAAAMKTQALSLNVEEVVAEGPGVNAAAWEAFADLRDKIAPGEKIGWWVVYNGDPERAYDTDDEDDEDYEEGEEYEEAIVAQEAEAETRPQQTPSPHAQPPLPTSQMVERTRPPQPLPKPRMFEQSDPNYRSPQQASALSPMRSPPAKGSGKRLPGMKATSPPPPPPPQLQQRQQEAATASAAAASKPRIAPKSESLKKKLFGKRN